MDFFLLPWRALGGGKDLETAVIYAKNSQKGQNENATVTSQSNVASAGGTKIKTESKVGGSKGGSTLGYDSLKQNASGPYEHSHPL